MKKKEKPFIHPILRGQTKIIIKFKPFKEVAFCLNLDTAKKEDMNQLTKGIVHQATTDNTLSSVRINTLPVNVNIFNVAMLKKPAIEPQK